jgi:hypothetical protein
VLTRSDTTLTIAIVGAGLGGLTAASTGEVMRELPMPESLFGAPYLCMHRGDLHEALLSVQAISSANTWMRGATTTHRGCTANPAS